MARTPSRHHTPEQVTAAFARAPAILRQLEALGVRAPRFELYGDASGCLILAEDDEQVTDAQVAAGTALVHSRRLDFCGLCMTDPAHKHPRLAIVFCCGLVNAAEPPQSTQPSPPTRPEEVGVTPHTPGPEPEMVADGEGGAP